jgi:predicted nucleic acid-binding protein
MCLHEFFERKTQRPAAGKQFISVITRMEILADSKHTEKTLRKAGEFLQNVFAVPLSGEIEEIAIKIRRSGSPRSKLPDAIVAATAVFLDVPLASADIRLLKLSWPGLQTMNIT